MMLTELRQLLAAGASTRSDGFRHSVVEDNALGKASVSGRQRTYRYLRELYGLNLAIPSFRGLTRLWSHDEQAQPLIALASALTRDGALRATANRVITAPIGMIVTADQLAEAVRETHPGNYRDSVAHKIGRNAAATWTQSGHLVGHTNKIRARANPRPASVAYALYLASLDDLQGNLLFESLPVRAQDAPIHVLKELAREASRLGWLDYRSIGNVAEIGFGFFETPGEARS
jgi:hypothetical protein